MCRLSRCVRGKRASVVMSARLTMLRSRQRFLCVSQWAASSLAAPRAGTRAHPLLCSSPCIGNDPVVMMRNPEAVSGSLAAPALTHMSFSQTMTTSVVAALLRSQHRSGPGIPAELISLEAFFLVHPGMGERLRKRAAVASHAVFKAPHAHRAWQPPYSRPYKTLRAFFHFANH